ncbi:MAG: DUF3710 domain-containing protein, partial [Nocardioidaceae bacterium]
ADDAPGEAADGGTDGGPDGGRGLTHGPWDDTELERDEDDVRIDLGCLLVAPPDGLDLQLQVEEASGEVMAAVLAGQTGAAELRVFAAPRHGDVWESLRRAVAAEVTRMGGTATEDEGPWGTGVTVQLDVELEDGQRATQISRVIGVPGPRWLLRVTMFGRPAVDFDEQGDVERAVRDLVVVRGSQPFPPGEPLPFTMPPEARPLGG